MLPSRSGLRLSSLAVVVCMMTSSPALAAPGAEPPTPPKPELIEPSSEPTSEASEGTSEPAKLEPPPPTLPDEPGIEFAIPQPLPEPIEPVDEVEDRASSTFPDPGMAPNDGASMLVLGSVTIGLTLMAFGAGLSVGLRNEVPLDWLLPSTIVPAVGVLAFAGGGLYLGIKRARAYRRWEIGNRVIGTPQGGGLAVGGSFMLLAALGFIPAGAFALRSDEPGLGATMIGLGTLAAVSMPIMFSLSSKRGHEYQRTGGWRRKPIPMVPIATPIAGGAMLGAAGRF